jgi:hypothetical protein
MRVRMRPGREARWMRHDCSGGGEVGRTCQRKWTATDVSRWIRNQRLEILGLGTSLGKYSGPSTESAALSISGRSSRKLMLSFCA